MSNPPKSDGFRGAFQTLLAQIPGEISESELAKLAKFAELLLEHGAKTNLIGTLDPDRIAEELIVDSMQMLPWVKAAQSCIDVGSGGGLPVIPLAIASPGTHFTSVEPREKRVNFMRFAKRTLGLTNLDLVEGRAQNGEVISVRAPLRVKSQAPATLFDLAISRAVFEPAVWLQEGRALVGPAGRVAVCINGDVKSLHSLEAGVSASGHALLDCRDYIVAGKVRSAGLWGNRPET